MNAYTPDQSRVNVFVSESVKEFKKADKNKREELLNIVKEGVKRYSEVLYGLTEDDYNNGIQGISYQDMAIKLEAGKQFLKKINR